MSHALPLRLEEAFSVRGKVVLLTGAVGTIGRGVAHVFAANGAKLICSDREMAHLEELARECKELGAEIDVRTADLQSADELKALLEFVNQRHQRVDAIIHCGAIPFSQTLHHEQDENFDVMFHTNVQSMWILARYSIPLFEKAGGGAFITFSSVNGHRPCIAAPFYVATKAAVMNMSRDLAAELAHKHIRFNTVSPGSTGQAEKHIGALAQSLHEPYAGRIREHMVNTEKDLTLRRDTDPTEVAHGLIYLVSDAGRRVNGADLLIDGGHLIATDWQQVEQGNKIKDRMDKISAELKAVPREGWKNGPPEWLK